MSVTYQAVSFNRQKKIYDSIIALGVVVYLALFFIISAVFHSNATFETLIIRATGSAAFILLHVVLVIGPLCRLSSRFLPLLYNRRHIGISLFLLALIHGAFSILQFHGFGDKNPLLSVFLSNTDYLSLVEFPFQVLGFAALLIFFLMAATSHDFWLANLSAPVWKALHMLIYLAYALVILHVSLGPLQSEQDPLLAGGTGLSLLLVLGLHLFSALKKEGKNIIEAADFDSEGYAYVCKAEEIPENRARIIVLSGERVAVFRYADQISAVSNVCQHQNGPLGEGEIVDGCITCPWHGFQYRPEDGCSPPPFREKVPTFRVKVEEAKVYVHPQPLVAGTHVEPARLS